ncbi:MAG: hypothetical protein R6U63_04600 [Longimicrobiales bacterium]
MLYVQLFLPGPVRDCPGRGPPSGPWLLLLGLLAVSGCAEPDAVASAAELTRSEFIDVVVALRTAEIELRDELDDPSALDARYQAAKDSILEAHGVHAGELYAFLELNRDLQTQDEVWDSIAQRLKRPRSGARSIPDIMPDEGHRSDPTELPGRELPNRETKERGPPGRDGGVKR